MAFLKIRSLSRHCAILMLALSVAFVAPAPSFAGQQEFSVSYDLSVVNGGDVGVPGEATEIASNQNNEDVNDPLEPINRVIFEFNELLQDAFFRPVAKFYNEIVNVTVRQAISNFLDNLSAPVVFVNDLLQGELDRAITTLGRAMINTTFGIIGIADVASEVGIEEHEEDFGQTMAVHGVGEGFYLVLPIFGPSNPRDAIGKMFVDSYFDPVGLWIDNTSQTGLSYALTGAKGIDEYAGIVDELDQVKKTSVDYYAAVRSLYRQKRKAEISNGSELELPPIPDLSYDLTPEDFNQPLAGVNQPSAQ
ncbi:MAG: VacJ family lipoprotein [Rhodospirillales bacterium]|nr:VacJ family lipoprotein [Alphaproteobacteria bacterium]MBL6948513.1 VacJ family lipoprotein [Rhodospirillales bacterium]